MRDFSKSLMVKNEDPYKFRRDLEKKDEDYEKSQLDKLRSIQNPKQKHSKIIEYLGQLNFRSNQKKKVSSPEHMQKLADFKKEAEKMLQE